MHVIVGSGIGGLYCAMKLIDHNPNCKITIYETRPYAGGRIQHSNIQSESADFGAWRVSNTHLRMIRLAKRLKIDLTPMLAQKSNIKTDIQCSNNKNNNNNLSNLSIFENKIKNQSIQDAYCQEISTGYDNILSGVHTTYLTTQKHKTYLVPKQGMYEFIEKLVKYLKKKVTFEFNSRVTAIQKTSNGYKLEILKRTHHNTFQKKIVESKILFLNIPPAVIRNMNLNFELEMKPIQAAIGSIPFFRIYVKLKKKYTQPIYFKNNSIFRQIILYKPKVLMLCYCSGRIADYHNNFSLTDKAQYINYLKENYIKISKKTQIFGKIR